MTKEQEKHLTDLREKVKPLLDDAINFVKKNPEVVLTVLPFILGLFSKKPNKTKKDKK